jgi:hypothetical protein
MPRHGLDVDIDLGGKYAIHTLENACDAMRGAR